MNAIDRALALSLPIVGATHGEPLPPVAVGQQRLVVASDGLYIEARSPALHVLQRVADASTPYGATRPFVRLTGEPVAYSELARIVGIAMSSPDSEIAAVVERSDAGSPKARRLAPISNGASHVAYADSGIDDDALLIDAHSHGRLDAYFSRVDDESDRSRRGPYIAMVVGKCDTEEPRIALRIVVGQHLIPTTLAALVEEGFVNEG